MNKFVNFFKEYDIEKNPKKSLAFFICLIIIINVLLILYVYKPYIWKPLDAWLHSETIKNKKICTDKGLLYRHVNNEKPSCVKIEFYIEK